MKAKMVTYKSATEDTGSNRLFEGQEILRSNNIKIGDVGMLVNRFNMMSRDIQILETQVDYAVKILNANGFEVVKIEDDIDIEEEKRRKKKRKRKRRQYTIVNWKL